MSALERTTVTIRPFARVVSAIVSNAYGNRPTVKWQTAPNSRGNEVQGGTARESPEWNGELVTFYDRSTKIGTGTTTGGVATFPTSP
jgi:hypothetical protein